MSSVKELVNIAQDVLQLLEKAHTNHKKCPKARLTSGYLQSKIKCIDEYRESLRSTHNQLIRIVTKEERASLSYFKEDLHSKFEELFLELKGDMTDLLESMKSQSTAGVCGGQQQQVSSVMESSGSIEGKVNLPKMNLPTFSGAYEDWQSFEDVFTSLIGTNKSISDVQKLHYLKSCVTGEAKSAIKNFQVTENNYIEAWNVLKNRYSHKRLIVDAILKRLFSSKKIINQSASQLKMLIDNTNECLSSLKGLNISTASWDPILVFLTTQKLDSETHKEWETFVSKEYHQDLPSFKSLTNFLESNIHTLVLIAQPVTTRANRERSFHATSLVQITCEFCSKNHFLYNCKDFGKLIPTKRREYVKDHRLCYNCLSSSHSVFNCKQKGSCRICGKRHHSLLHLNMENGRGENGSHEVKDNTTGLSSLHTNVEVDNDVQQDISITSHLATGYTQALLATALVPVRSFSGHITILRALIDSGSQASFISERAVQSLQLKRTAIHGTVTGVGSTTTTVSHVVQLEVLSRFDEEFSLPVRAYVLSSHVTTKLPYKSIKPREQWSYLDGLNLADPQYFVSSKIDMLLGVEVYTEIIKNNLIKGPPGSPTAQDTTLGWILFGNIGEERLRDSTILVMHHKLEVDVDNLLRNLWNIEETSKRELTAEERKCEEIYLSNYKRSAEGRYIVKLPMKGSVEEIGNTREIALKRFQLLERRLEKRPTFKEEYKRVLEEYMQLNHMERVPEEDKKKKAIYLPHHAVIKEESTTSKVRIVFDASCKGSKGKSLNDILMIGPKLQEDLRYLVMRWRLKPVCFATDIQKMYRMILVKEDDADLQRILWRKSMDEEVEEYRLMRVTFGTASAPYLAVKTIMQLAEDEGKDHPEAAKTIKEDFYVDDCLSGGYTDKEALELAKRIKDILKRGGFILQKWASNSKYFLDNIESEEETLKINKQKESVIKILGLYWNLESDSFQYQFKLPHLSEIITKRNILADIQRLFDPLGWLGAAIIQAKILIQKLWVERLDWDEYVGDSLKEEWLEIRNSFDNLQEVKVKRWIKTENKDLHNISIHGFSDASNAAYCAVIYYRVETNDGKIETGIIASKTRVSPLKPVSIPRLELCAAVLLARLLTQVRVAMRIPIERVYAWTDSSVVLSWLCGDPLRWKVFVSNRVVEILDNLGNAHWFHVKSKENPADIGSRGLELKGLIRNKLWWEGPEWLKEKVIHYSRPNFTSTDITDMERKKVQVNTKIMNESSVIKFNDFNSLEELLRVVVFCKRFLRYKKDLNEEEKPITAENLEESLNLCIRVAQKETFMEEIDRLRNKMSVKKSSKLKSLNPYLDDSNILKVGGRLRNSDLMDESKHPIIIDGKSQLGNLIIAQAHRKTLHGGIQLMLCFIRSKYWMIGAKNAVKVYVHKCIICARQKAAIRTQIMGDLPKVRTTPARPFLHSGVDFAGPIQVLISRGRGAKSSKAYIAIFVCMATKAIHLELVGDMTSESFIGAFHRFVARRGRCTHIWSDQGRNFVGANKLLMEAWKEAKLELPAHLCDVLASEGTTWHFLPPYSPNFGGLWESGVRSVKHHLRRILTARLTFEEMATTLCQIEACLNSRPLTPIDTTDTDYEVLTPGHFLIGEAPVNIPSIDLRDCNVSRLSRWQYVQRLVRDFWHRWQTEYLGRLQQRPKWLKHVREFEVGDVVLLKDEQLPPGKWPLGRIVNKHPGPDNITRVYSIKCAGDTVKRSISKLCYLPIDVD